jgi:hypothetical protein
VYLQTFCVFIHATHVSPSTVQQIVPNPCAYGSLDASTIVRLTATKFEPCIFFMLGFALAYVLNIHIIMILNNFCLFLAYVGYIIIKIRNLERQM